MSPKRLSWKDVIVERQKESFVGRKDYIKQFTENFASDVPNYLLFFVIGEGGVGKSTLLRQFEAIGKNVESDTIVITCDDEQSSPVAAMGCIAEKLAKFDISIKEFNEKYKIYRTRRDEIQSDPKAPRGALNLVVRGMTDFAIKAARRAPGLGVFAEYVDEKEAGDALTLGVNYLVDRIGNKDEVQLLREPEKTLTPLFIELLNKVCEGHRLVLMFDVFERTREALEPWLLEFLDFKFGEFDTGITFVISGRDTTDQRWTKIASSICYITLEPFTFEETRSYLRFRKITNKQLVAQIFEDTGGLPVLVELLAGTKPKPGSPLPDISQNAVKRFLQWIPDEERRQVALFAAVPLHFNLDIISAVLGKNANNDFNWLSVQSYIRANTARGWFYHEKVRELMLRYLRNTKPGDLAAVHSRLAAYFESQQKIIGLTEKEAYTSISWQELEAERVYHLLSASPNTNEKEVINAFLHAFRWNWSFASNIVQSCMQAARGTGSHELHASAQILDKLFKTYDKNEYQEFIAQANLIASRDDLSTVARAALYNRRGSAFRALGNKEQALADFNRAIELDSKYVLAFINRGRTYRQMENYDQALSDFDHAIALDEGRDTAFANRGYTYELMERYEEALNDYNHAIQLDDKYIWAIGHRGVVCQSLGKYDQAFADFNWLIKFDERDLWAYTNRGITYQRLGEFEQAIKEFDFALSIDDTYTWALANRGNNKRILGKFDDALKDFNRAIALDDKFLVAIKRRGQTYELMNKFDKALEDFNTFIDVEKNDSWVYAHRGNAYRNIGEYQRAIEDYSHAISLNENYSWAIANRGQVYRLMNDYESAIADYDRAIALDDKYSSAINARGYTYQLMGKYESAIEDYDRVIAIDENYVRALRNRGNTFRLMRKYERAIVDINRIIILDGKDAANWAMRGDLFWEIGDMEKALADFNQAIELDKTFHWAYERKSLILRSLNQLEDALHTLVIAQETVEKCTTCISFCGEIHRRMGDLQTAMLYFNISIDIESDNTSFELSRRAAIYQSLENIEARDQDIEQVLKLTDEEASIYYNKAVVSVLANRLEDALNLLKAAINKDPSARTYARYDDLFKPLNNYPEFQEIIKPI